MSGSHAFIQNGLHKINDIIQSLDEFVMCFESIEDDLLILKEETNGVVNSENCSRVLHLHLHILQSLEDAMVDFKRDLRKIFLFENFYSVTLSHGPQFSFLLTDQLGYLHRVLNDLLEYTAFVHKRIDNYGQSMMLIHDSVIRSSIVEFLSLVKAIKKRSELYVRLVKKFPYLTVPKKKS